MSWVPKICNKLRKDLSEKTRYGRYDVLHVSDALDCQVKMYLDRVLASSQSCASLARMKQGRMWEHYVRDIFEAENYVFEKVLRGDMVYEYRGEKLRDIDLIATPDFTNLNKKYVVELKTTRWSLEEVQLITRHILDTLKALDTPLPEYDVSKYPVFPSAIAAVCAYRGGLPKKGRPVLGETKMIYIYRDTLQEYDVPRDLVNTYNGWFLECRVPIGIWTLYRVKEMFGPERRIPHMSFDLDVVKKLYRFELHSEGLYNYFKCATCAYRGDPCPSLPSLTVPDFADLDLMEKMLAKLRDYGMISLSSYESLATRLNVLRKTRIDAEWNRHKMGEVKNQLIKFILALRRAVKSFDEELPVVKKVVWSDPFVLEKRGEKWVEKPLEKKPIPEEIRDLVEYIRENVKTYEDLMYGIQVLRTRPFSRLAAIIFKSPEQPTIKEILERKEPREVYEYLLRLGVVGPTVTIYRGGSEIKPGDWVALDYEYAKWHGEPVFDMEVPITDVVWAGTSVEEYYYVPEKLRGYFKDLEEFWKSLKDDLLDRLERLEEEVKRLWKP